MIRFLQAWRYLACHAVGAPERQDEIPVTALRYRSLRELTIRNRSRFDAFDLIHLCARRTSRDTGLSV